MSIKIDKQYTTFLSKKYSDLHPTNEPDIFKNGSLRDDINLISPPGGSLVLGGAWYGGWDYKARYNYTVGTGGRWDISGSSSGFANVTSYFDADKVDFTIFNFWDSKTETYRPVTLKIAKREELIGYRYFEDDPNMGAGYWGASVEAHDLKFYDADKTWAYDVIKGEASYPEEEGHWGNLPKALTYYTTESPFVSYIDINAGGETLGNLRIVPMINSFLKNTDGNWVGKLGFGVYRNTYGVKTWSHSTISMEDNEIMSVICPDENGPFGNWLIDIGAPNLSKEIQWFEGKYTVNLNSNITIS